MPRASAFLTRLKRTEGFAWLNEVSPVPRRQVLRTQQEAFADFFAGRARYPRHKSRTGRRSAEHTRSGFRYRDGRLLPAKMNTPPAFIWSWPDIDPATINPSTVTVSRDPSGRRYVSFAVETGDPDQATHTGAVAGMHLGIKTFAVTSGGEKIADPRSPAKR